MQSNKETKKRSHFNAKRECYLSADGRFYCYEYWDPENKRMMTQRFEVGKDLSLELTMVLNESDHRMDLSERYRDENCCALFDEVVSEPESDEEESVTDPRLEEIRRIIEEKCTEEQKQLVFEYFGQRRQLEELRQAEAARTGRLVSSQAMTNRLNKIIDKAAKALGVERVKRRRISKD